MLNHVTTGDAAFDDLFSVVALEGQAPSAAALLQSLHLRRMLAALFSRHPFAYLEGGRLSVPTDGGVSASDVASAVQVMNEILTRFSNAAQLPAEPPADASAYRRTSWRQLTIPAAVVAMGWLVATTWHSLSDNQLRWLVVAVPAVAALVIGRWFRA